MVSKDGAFISSKPYVFQSIQTQLRYGCDGWADRQTNRQTDRQIAFRLVDVIIYRIMLAM